MSKISITPNPSGSGVFTISSPATSTDRTLTLPDEAGTVLTTATAGVPIGGPAFSAYASGATTLSAGTITKILFDTEEYDTNSNFASSRFTPTVAGYYLCITAWAAGSTPSDLRCYLYKNGTSFKRMGAAIYNVLGNWTGGSAMAYCNGTSDYLEMYGFSNAANTTGTGADLSYFQASMVRSAV